MIKIEIREELIDWLEEHADGLSREDCEEFAQEFISFIVMTGSLTVSSETVEKLIDWGLSTHLCEHCGPDDICGFCFEQLRRIMGNDLVPLGTQRTGP